MAEGGRRDLLELAQRLGRLLLGDGPEDADDVAKLAVVVEDAHGAGERDVIFAALDAAEAHEHLAFLVSPARALTGEQRGIERPTVEVEDLEPLPMSAHRRTDDL